MRGYVEYLESAGLVDASPEVQYESWNDSIVSAGDELED